MSLFIFLVVLCAALLHALWNATVKGGSDKSLNMSAVVLGMGTYGGLSLLFFAAPARESWLFIAASVLLHYGYQEFLLASYRIGDLTQVYPIARGSAPLIVALVSVLWLGADLGRAELLAVALIGLGVASLSLVRQRDGLRNGRAALLALTTGGFIASYSLVDGVGARLAGSPVAFFGAISFFNAGLYLLVSTRVRPHVIAHLPRAWPIMVIAGGASFAAYALVVFAFTHAPIALVTALRETSVVFALPIGVIALAERLSPMKLLSTLLALAGAALLRLGAG